MFGSTPPYGQSFSSNSLSSGAFGVSTSPLGSSTTSSLFGTTTGAFGMKTSPFGSNTPSLFGNTTLTFGVNTSSFGSSTTSSFGTTTGAFGVKTSPFGSNTPSLFGNTTSAFGVSTSPFGSSTPSSFGNTTSAFGANTSPFGAKTLPFGSTTTMGENSSSPFGGSQNTTSSFTTTGFSFGTQHEGSRKAPYTSTPFSENGFSGKLQSIAAMPIHEGKSVEQLRWEDYKSGNKGVMGSFSAFNSAGQSNARIASDPATKSSPNPFSSQTSSNIFSNKTTFGPFSKTSPGPFSSQSSPSQISSQTSPNIFSTQTSFGPFSNQTPSSTFLSQTSTGSFSTQTPSNPFASQTFSNPFASQTSFNASTAQSTTNQFTSQTTPSPFTTQTSPSPFNQTSPSTFTTQTTPGSFTTQTNPNPFTTQTNHNLFTNQTNSSPFTNQTNLSSFTTQANPSPFTNQTNAHSFTTQTNPNPFTNKTIPSLFTTQTNPSPFTSQTNFKPLTTETSPSLVFSKTTRDSFPFQPLPPPTTTSGSFSFLVPSNPVSSIMSPTALQATQTSQSTVVTQPAVNANPFGVLPAMPHLSISHPKSTSSVQHGISSIPVVDKSSASVRLSSSLASRLLSQHRIRLPSRRYDTKSETPKVPFFSKDQDMAPVSTQIVPRENPRALVILPAPQRTGSEKMNASIHEIEKDLLSSENNTESKNALGFDFSQEGALNKNLAVQELEFEGPNTIKIPKEDSDDINLLMPQLSLSGYYTEPSLQECAEKEKSEPGFCTRVKDFIVGHRSYGSIKFLGETNVEKLNLDSIIEFNNREVIIYKHEIGKPPVGQGLNKPAEVTLLNIKCSDKNTGKVSVCGPKVEKYKELLTKKCKEQGAEFLSFDPVKGEWKFRVQQF